MNEQQQAYWTSEPNSMSISHWNIQYRRIMEKNDFGMLLLKSGHVDMSS